jgi:hypothetical protein
MNACEATAYEISEDFCPHCSIEADVCKASISALSLGKLVRSSYCESENYDNCAIFLAKSLRRRQ